MTRTYSTGEIFRPAEVPTMYFVGVTTGRSSIRRVFPAWMAELGADVELVGVDLPLRAEAQRYREFVQFLREDALSLGALVTTHKLDLYDACTDLFDEITPIASALGETSCLAKREGKLLCDAKDPITSGLALDAILPSGYFDETEAGTVILGAGGSAKALIWHLISSKRAGLPQEIHVTNRGAERLDLIAATFADSPTRIIAHRVTSVMGNDAVVDAAPPGSLIVNATGLGKDAPGSPISDAARFPDRSIAWDLNYRGELVFLEQAAAQHASGVRVVDGWDYFLHGWLQVIQEVLDRPMPTSGPRFEALARLAVEVGR